MFKRFTRDVIEKFNKQHLTSSNLLIGQHKLGGYALISHPPSQWIASFHSAIESPVALARARADMNVTSPHQHHRYIHQNRSGTHEHPSRKSEKHEEAGTHKGQDEEEKAGAEGSSEQSHSQEQGEQRAKVQSSEYDYLLLDPRYNPDVNDHKTWKDMFIDTWREFAFNVCFGAAVAALLAITITISETLEEYELQKTVDDGASELQAMGKHNSGDDIYSNT